MFAGLSVGRSLAIKSELKCLPSFSASHDCSGCHYDLANSVASAADCIVAAARLEYPQAAFGIWGTVADVPAKSPWRQRIEAEMVAQIPICTIDFTNPKNQWR